MIYININTDTVIISKLVYYIYIIQTLESEIYTFIQSHYKI